MTDERELEGIMARPMPPPLVFGYTNHRGEYAVRRVRPVTVWYGKTGFYDTERWLLRAYDLDRGSDRDFDMAQMTPVTL